MSRAMSMLLAPLLLLTSPAATSAAEALPPQHTAVSPSSNTAVSEPFSERPLLLEVQVGLAMPTGLVGAYVDYAIVPELSLAAGFGTNLSGFEAAAELRVRTIIRHRHALGFMAGYSAGPHSQSEATKFGFFSLFLGPLTAMGEGRIPSSYRWDLAQWGNMSLFYEQRRPSGMNIRVFAGPAILLNPEDGYAAGTTDDPHKLRWEPVSTMIFAGFGMGYAL
jgi:hypothetical protein